MRPRYRWALLALLPAACLSSPTPADPDIRDAGSQFDGGPGDDGGSTLDGATADGGMFDASSTQPDGSTGTGELVCDSTSGSVFGRSFFVGMASGDYALISDAAHVGLDLNGSFTLEAWLALSALPTEADTYTIVSKDDFGANSRAYVWYLERQGSSIVVRTRIAQGNNSRGSEMQWTWSGAEVNRWHHFALIFDISQTTVAGSLTLLIDGVAVGGIVTNAEVDQVDIGNSTAAFVVGAWPQGGVPESYFVGAIDEVRVWSVARTVSQVQQARDVTISASSPGLVGYWQFNDQLLDSTANNNDLAGPSPDYCAGPN